MIRILTGRAIHIFFITSRWPFSMLFDPRYPELQMMKVELSVQRKFLYMELRG